MNPCRCDRRSFLTQAVTASLAGSCLGHSAAISDGRKRKKKTPADRPIGAFVKFIQELSYTELAETIERLGFQGIEATVRPGGHVLPERVEDDLPRLVEALDARGLKVLVMASNVNDATDPLSQKVLKTASELGIQRYRMAYYRYDLAKPVLPQLDNLKSSLRDLAVLNQELGLTAVYQNHSGASNVGASIWDLMRLLEPISKDQIGVAFDIRHATVEGGLAWPVSWNLVQSHLQAVYVKDFVWEGRKPRNVPLGTGQVDPRFFPMMSQIDSEIPVSLHIEYLGKAGLQPNIAALQTDLQKLRKLMKLD